MHAECQGNTPLLSLVFYAYVTQIQLQANSSSSSRRYLPDALLWQAYVTQGDPQSTGFHGAWSFFASQAKQNENGTSEVAVGVRGEKDNKRRCLAGEKQISESP